MIILQGKKTGESEKMWTGAGKEMELQGKVKWGNNSDIIYVHCILTCLEKP